MCSFLHKHMVAYGRSRSSRLLKEKGWRGRQGGRELGILAGDDHITLLFNISFSKETQLQERGCICLEQTGYRAHRYVKDQSINRQYVGYVFGSELTDTIE